MKLTRELKSIFNSPTGAIGYFSPSERPLLVS
jgi:hypothetical protein